MGVRVPVLAEHRSQLLDGSVVNLQLERLERGSGRLRHRVRRSQDAGRLFRLPRGGERRREPFQEVQRLTAVVEASRELEPGAESQQFRGILWHVPLSPCLIASSAGPRRRL